MIRDLRFIGVALVALTMSAITASVASADEFKSESAPVTLTGTGGATADSGSFHVGVLTCTAVDYKGTLSGASVTTIQLTPIYTGCRLSGLMTLVSLNGCEFLFHIPAAAGVTTGTTDIVCPGANEITITSPNPVLGQAKCIIHIPPQTGLGVVTYSNLGAGMTREIKAAMNLSGITYSQTAGIAESGNCETRDNTTTGTYVGGVTLTGEVDGGSTHIGLFLA